MGIKALICYLLFFLTGLQVSFCQNEWLSIDLNDSSKKPIEVINMVDESNGNIALFFKYSNFIKAYLYNKDRNLINKLHISELPRYSSNYLGCSRLNNDYTLFFKNLGSTKYSSLTINFKGLSFSTKDNIGISLKRESFIESFEDNNQVYILTSINKTSKLKLRTLFVDNSFETKLVDLSNETFEKPNKISTNLSILIRGLKQEVKTNSIKVGEPSSLEIASAKNKLYYNNNIITFTSNYFDHCTYLIEIDISDGGYKFSKLNNVNYNKEDLWNKANSFIYDNYIFNMYVSKNGLLYDIYNRETKELIKKLEFNKNETIPFKNSPIILEGGDFKDYRELERTIQFIRKVTNSKVSTYVYKSEGHYVISMGSSESKEQAPFMYYAGGGLVGGLVVGVANALLTSTYQSYITTKSTRIECLFDENFNHVSGEIPINGFDRIKNYVDEKNLERAPLQSVFKYDNDYIFGYYNKDLNIYSYTYIKK